MEKSRQGFKYNFFLHQHLFEYFIYFLQIFPSAPDIRSCCHHHNNASWHFWQPSHNHRSGKMSEGPKCGSWFHNQFMCIWLLVLLGCAAVYVTEIYSRNVDAWRVFMHIDSIYSVRKCRRFPAVYCDDYY